MFCVALSLSLDGSHGDRRRSTDATWEVLSALRPRYPQLRLFRFGENRGKRHAMALGAEKAKGEILDLFGFDSFVARS